MTKICTLKILDEVNVKICGLDGPSGSQVRRKIVNKLKFDIPGARYMPAVRLGRWDGKVSFCTVGGSTYINVLDRVLPIIDQAGYEIELEDYRLQHDIDISLVDENVFDGKIWPDGHPVAGEPIVLRDYQVKCVNEYISNPQCIQEISTGAGKTILTAALSYLVEKNTNKRTIVIVPNKDLVRQTEKDYLNVGLDTGVYYGDRKDIGKQHTICTWQSLDVLNKKGEIDDLNVMDAFLYDVNCVIVDECFDGDTLIQTPTGHKKISEIEIGDKVINYDENAKMFKEDVIVNVYENLMMSSKEDMYELEFDNGCIVKVTGNHKLLTENRDWIRVDELNECDKLIHDSSELKSLID